MLKSEKALRTILVVIGAYFTIEGLATIFMANEIAGLYGVLRAGSTTTVRTVAGDLLFIGLALLAVAWRPKDEGMVVTVAALVCLGRAIVLFYSANMVVGVPPGQARGEIIQGAMYLAVGLCLGWLRLKEQEILGPVWTSRRYALPLPALSFWSLRIFAALLGLMIMVSMVKVIGAPHAAAVGNGIPLGMLWTVTPGRLVGASHFVIAAGLVYVAIRPQATRLFLMMTALILMKNVALFNYMMATVAVPMEVAEATAKNSIAFTVMGMVLWVLTVAVWYGGQKARTEG